MKNISKHLVRDTHKLAEVLPYLDVLGKDSVLFVQNAEEQLIGALTDGDVRRGLMKGNSLGDAVTQFMNAHPKFLYKNDYDIDKLIRWRNSDIEIIPILDSDNRILDVINFNIQKSHLPIDAVLMAGGKGTRLYPLTINTPKPLLKVGDKPIIEYNIDRLKDFGVKNITLTIKYLGQQLIDYFKDGSEKDLRIGYVEEDEPLGTIGGVRLIERFYNDYVLVMNSDLLTNINYEDMFKFLVDKSADMVVATIPYEVRIPYGVIETDGEQITAIKEKPTYTYYSNAGIYIFKKEYLNTIPKNKFYNATDLMEDLYKNGQKVVHFPIVDYWLDIGKPHDFEKAQHDIKHIKF